MYDDNDMFETAEDNGHRSSVGDKILLFLFLIVMMIIALPALIVWAIHFFILFLFRKNRFSVIAPMIVIELLIFTPLAMRTGISTLFKNLLDRQWSGMLISWVLWCIVFGLVISFVSILFKVLQFRLKPSVLSAEGEQYKFQYRETPWQKMISKLNHKRLLTGDAYREDGAPVGILSEPPAKRVNEIDDDKARLANYFPSVIYRSYKDAVRQTVITGQTGSGKSISMLSLMYNDILNGIPLCVVDFKKSSDVLYFLSKWAKDNDREFYYFTNGDGEPNDFYGEQATYDPLATGDQTSRADFILNLREWDASADVYKQRTQEILQGVLYALIEVPHSEAPGIDWKAGNLKQLITALDLNNMYDLASYLSKELDAGKLDATSKLRVENFMSNYREMSDKRSSDGKALLEQLAGIRTVCNKLIMSSYGKWLMEGSSDKHINLLNIASDKKAPICLFAFSAQEEPDFAKSMGQVIMSDLNRVSAAKTGMGNKDLFGVYVDEFQTLNPKFIADLLAKARSAGFFITIASQSLEQITAAATENADAVLQSILDVCGNYLFLKGAKEDSAEKMAKIMGKTKHIVRHSSSKTNTGLLNFKIFNSRNGIVQSSIEDDWIVSPARFQGLRDAVNTNGQFSEAYFISTNVDSRGKKENAAQRVRIVAQRDLLPGPSDEFQEFIKNQTYNHLQKGQNPTKRATPAPVALPKSNPFADLQTAHKVNNYPDVNNDYDTDMEDIESEFEEIEPTENTSPKPVISEQIRTAVPSQQKKVPVVKHTEPTIETQPIKKEQPPKLEETKTMTTFERMQWEKKHPVKRAPQKTIEDDKNFPGRDEPELLSRSLEGIPREEQKKNEAKSKKFTLPKL